MAFLKWTLLVLYLQFQVPHPQAASWTNDIPSSVKGLPGSCVVIPCSYDFPNPGKKLTHFTGIWTDHTKQAIFHSVQSKIMQQYRDRTELLGDLSQKNCSLKIDPLQQSDQGPFSFRIEIANYNKFSYPRTVSITMINQLDPVDLSVQEEAKGAQTAACSVSHFCPFSPPTFNWSHTGQTQLQSQQLEDGRWRATSTLTFHPTRVDHNKPLWCTVRYKGGQHHQASKVLKVKYAPMNVKVEYQSTVKEGEDVQMNCSGDANPPVSSYEWYNVTGARLYTGKVFVLQNVSRHHSGELYCTAINKLGRGNSSPVHPDVLYAPMNVKVEYQSTVKEGEDVQMNCSGGANPPVSSYEWYNITGARLYMGKIFVLQNVSRHHSGDLYCTAINKLGRGNSSPVHLDVLYAPEVNNKSSCFSEADMMKCECIVDSSPPSTVHFVLADEVLPSTHVESNESLTIGTLQADLGPYKFVICLANNTQGHAEFYIPLGNDMHLYLFIAIGAGVLLILLIIIGVSIKCGRGTKAAPTSHIHSEKDVDIPQYSLAQRIEKNNPNDELYQNSCACNEPVYGNVQTVWDEAIYANLYE